MDICFVAAGMAASGALTVSGAVYMWGQQSCGQLGDARPASVAEDIVIPALVSIPSHCRCRQLALGDAHSLAVTEFAMAGTRRSRAAVDAFRSDVKAHFTVAWAMTLHLRAKKPTQHKTPLVRAESLLEPETPRQFASTLRRRKEQGSLVRNKEAARARASKRSTKSPSPPPPLKKQPTKRTLAAKAAKPARKHAARPSQFGDLDRTNEFGVYDPVVEPEPLEEEDEEETLRKAAREQIHAASVPTIDDEFHAVKLAQHRLAKSRHAMRGHKKDGTRDDSHKVNAMEAIVRKRRDLGQVALRCNMRKIIDLWAHARAHRLWARRKRKDRLRKKAFRIQTMNESALRKYRAISRGQDPRESDEEDESDDASDDDCLPDMRTHRHLQNIAEADVSDEEAEEEEPPPAPSPPKRKKRPLALWEIAKKRAEKVRATANLKATVSDMRVFGCIVDSQHTEDITLRTRERTVTRVGETFIDRSVAARLKERRPSEVDISEDVDLDALLASVDDRQRALEEDAGGDGPRRRSRPASAAARAATARRRREPTPARLPAAPRYLELNKFKDEAFVVPEPVRSSPRRGGSPRRPISAPCRRSGRRPAGRSMASMDPGAVSFLWVPSRAARRGAAGGRRRLRRQGRRRAAAPARVRGHGARGAAPEGPGRPALARTYENYGDRDGRDDDDRAQRRSRPRSANFARQQRASAASARLYQRVRPKSAAVVRVSEPARDDDYDAVADAIWHDDPGSDDDEDIPSWV
ncbi:hypothetical protein JL721_5405 [Aureococcus anophagefferens]|nr:hypothetical protein JL721_5405 [Aureococcus anophagefferens]